MSHPTDNSIVAAESGRLVRGPGRGSRDGASAELKTLSTPPFELERVITLAEAAELTGLSRDSLQRHYARLIRRLSPRRVGMKLRDVLAIGN